MRVTQSMLSNNMLRNLNTNYSKLSKLQEQINSGSVLTRPSDDPVIAIKGMQNRIQVDQVEQYERNLNEAYSWLDTSDTVIGQVGDILNRVKELVIQAANDTNTPDARKYIADEVSQLKEHLRDLGNTKVGDNYIFTGTHTDMPMYTDSTSPQNPALTTNGAANSFKINVFDGVSLKINSNASELFKQADEYLAEVSTVLNSGRSGAEIGATLGATMTTNGGVVIPALDAITDEALAMRSDIGARQNRVDMMANRLSIQHTNAVKQLSENEDTDYAKTITEMTSAQSIHQASLSVGANIIQQTLVDFIR